MPAEGKARALARVLRAVGDPGLHRRLRLVGVTCGHPRAGVHIGAVATRHIMLGSATGRAPGCVMGSLARVHHPHSSRVTSSPVWLAMQGHVGLFMRNQRIEMGTEEIKCAAASPPGDPVVYIFGKYFTE